MENGTRYETIRLAKEVLEQKRTVMVYYTGRGLDIFGYYVANHNDLKRAIKEYKEIAFDRTMCRLENDVIGHVLSTK